MDSEKRARIIHCLTCVQMICVGVILGLIIGFHIGRP